MSSGETSSWDEYGRFNGEGPPVVNLRAYVENEGIEGLSIIDRDKYYTLSKSYGFDPVTTGTSLRVLIDYCIMSRMAPDLLAKSRKTVEICGPGFPVVFLDVPTELQTDDIDINNVSPKQKQRFDRLVGPSLIETVEIIDDHLDQLGELDVAETTLTKINAKRLYEFAGTKTKWPYVKLWRAIAHGLQMELLPGNPAYNDGRLDK